MVTALVTGVLGQDGQILARRLMAEGRTVVGISRGTEKFPNDLKPEPVHRHFALDLADLDGTLDAISSIRPDVIFHLAGQTSVARSWESPQETFTANVLGTQNILRAALAHAPDTRIVVTSSGEVFAPNAGETLLNEESEIGAQSPYALSKLIASETASYMREYLNLNVSVAYLFPHESLFRPETFVSRKITRNVARIACGDLTPFDLGNIDAVRDWGWAEDYVDGLLRMSQVQTPSDYVFASGEGHSVREFLTEAFRAAGMTDYQDYVRIEPTLLRKNDNLQRLGDSSKARRELGWNPSTSFADIAHRMVEHDIRLASA